MKAKDVLSDNQNQLVRDGVVVRKGTVGAFLINAKAWSSAPQDSPERTAAGDDILEALPAQRAMGLFDVLDIHDDALRQWIASREHG